VKLEANAKALQLLRNVSLYIKKKKDKKKEERRKKEASPEVHS